MQIRAHVQYQGRSHPEHSLFKVEVVEIIRRFDIWWAAVIAEGDIPAALDQRNQCFQIGFDGLRPIAQREFIDPAHDAQFTVVFAQQLARVRAAVHFEREQAVDAAVQQPAQDGAHVAVAIGIPEIDAVGMQLAADTLVARHDDVVEKFTETIGPFLKQISSHPEA